MGVSELGGVVELEKWGCRAILCFYGQNITGRRKIGQKVERGKRNRGWVQIEYR